MEREEIVGIITRSKKIERDEGSAKEHEKFAGQNLKDTTPPAPWSTQSGPSSHEKSLRNTSHYSLWRYSVEE